MNDRPDSEIYKKANQKFAGKYTLDRDVKFEEIIDHHEIKELLGNDWESYEQYCSLCGAKDIKDFKVLKAITDHNIPTEKGKQLIMLICEKCQSYFSWKIHLNKI